MQWRRRRRLISAFTVFTIGAVLLVGGLVRTHAVLVIGVIIAVVGVAAVVTAAVVLLHGPRRHGP